MTNFNSGSLLRQQQQEVEQLIQIVEELSVLPTHQLLQAPAIGQWSIAQCLEHLNSYGHYYLPLMEQAIRQGEARQLPPTDTFRSSWLGDYFTNAMLPKADGSIGYKAKAFKNHQPKPQLDAKAVLTKFLRQQHQLIHLLQQAQSVNIGRLKIPISIARWISLPLGDAFRFLIAHEVRHVLQAQKARKAILPSGPSLVSQ
ncbi:DinB family protein [Nibrella saemangeumensis]|uniref:DinB family protein n=1 Tax=Nibrella saemangeumensis TaxID=1084526 RepID=A0ABP8MCZ4_9BACT